MAIVELSYYATSEDLCWAGQLNRSTYIIFMSLCSCFFPLQFTTNCFRYFDAFVGRMNRIGRDHRARVRSVEHAQEASIRVRYLRLMRPASTIVFQQIDRPISVVFEHHVIANSTTGLRRLTKLAISGIDERFYALIRENSLRFGVEKPPTLV